MTKSQTSKGKILVADDQPANLDILFRNLSQVGYKVLIAKSGQSAVRQAERTQPDVILLDVMMPGMDGFKTCSLLKENEATCEIPIIFMTALNDVNSKVRGFEAGAVDYVTKPFDFKEVLARVDAHLTIRNLQRELQQKNEILQTQNDELSAFAYTVAHDLKNPLLPVMIGAELLATEESLSKNGKENVEFICRNVSRMNNIIQELLLLAGVRQAEVIPEPLDMGLILTEVLERVKHLIKDKQVRINVPTEWPVAIGYAPWIEEVWVNYLSNAIKYSGSPPEIHLGATEHTNERVEFWIKDNGLGLTPEEQAQVFVPFIRLSQIRTEGHGLGLSIVLRIMQKLGGTVGVESQHGQGCKFSFSLPISSDKLSPQRVLV